MKNVICKRCNKNPAEYSGQLQGWIFCKDCRTVKTRVERNNYGIPEKYKNAKLEDFPEQLITLLAEKSNNFETGLVVYGDTYKGKTYLLSAIANNLNNVMFFCFVEFIHQLWESVENKTSQEFIKDVANCDYLFLDDLFVNKMNDFVYEKTYYIINHRVLNGLPTFYSYNGKLEDKMIDDRLRWRILEGSVLFELKKNYKIS